MAKVKKVVKEPVKSEKQVEIDALLANPNRQPADDKRLDLLLHGVAAVEPVEPVEGEPLVGHEEPANVEEKVNPKA